MAHWEPLKIHLAQVADRAAGFAKVFGAEAEARFIGLLHDLGKYSERFVERLHGRAGHLDHWSIGAWAAAKRLGIKGIAAAAAIQGHHLGLRSLDRVELSSTLNPKSARSDGRALTEADHELLLRRLAEDGLTLPDRFETVLDPDLPKLAQMLDVRMLFSCLVDADFLETEAHFKGQSDGRRVYRPDGPGLRPGRAVGALDAHLDALAASSTAAEHVLRLRTDLRRACEDAAGLPPGLFTLTAPTGTGKTLAMLAFALRHAREHGLRRVVLAVPYLTIIEQTAGIYRDLFRGFDDNFVLEHHSLTESRGTGDDNDPGRSQLPRLLAENWDAPLVLTTNVQLLHSLFANRPGACRKLHRLARSVILFDEVQTLPRELAVPTLAALSHLAERYGSTVIFSTATQPAFTALDTAVRDLAPTGWNPREIVPASLGLFQRARRVRVRFDREAPRIPWSQVAETVAAHDQVLTIVNLKRHALELVKALQGQGVEGILHLSTNLCPAHRTAVLDEVRRLLDSGQGEPCRLVATQCVEAGVDVDFPMVNRAMGPLEAIAQAAGRCNRHGRMREPGEVWVFLPELDDRPEYPPGGYGDAASVARQIFEEAGGKGLDIDDPETFRHYYERLYRRTFTADAFPKLREAVENGSFVDVADLYQLIRDDTIQVVVPYEPATYRRLCEDVRRHGLSREWIAGARPHVVSLFRPKDRSELWNVLEPVRLRDGRETSDWFLHVREDAYDSDLLGLVEADDLWIA